MCEVHCPGIVDTDRWELIDEKLGGYLGVAKGQARKQYSQLITLGYLAGPDSDNMTGNRS
jgi:meso-butanediol dehydrogenase/(S,S)-butanediol dehydrogenase/diacetyl reductase